MSTSSYDILYIDAYDSFTNNILSLLHKCLPAPLTIRVVKIDDARFYNDTKPSPATVPAGFVEELRKYDAVVCGPGPGHPSVDEDVGLMRWIWQLAEEDVIPALGICLGFQSLCLSNGATVKRLHGGQHGIVREVSHVGLDIFSGVGAFEATLYQSLCVHLDHDHVCNDGLPSSLEPLAWVEANGMTVEERVQRGIKDEVVLVAVKHRQRPWWGLQYHPESVCTKQSASEAIIQNWWKEVLAYNERTNRVRQTSTTLCGDPSTRQSLLAQHHASSSTDLKSTTDNALRWRNVELSRGIETPDIIEALGLQGEDVIVLDSSNAQQTDSAAPHVRGRHSIIALDIPTARRYEYRIGDDFATLSAPAAISDAFSIKRTRIPLSKRSQIWPLLAHHLQAGHIETGNVDSPFWGGFLGYTSYELGLEGLGIAPIAVERQHPDLVFVWVTRSLVVDYDRNIVYVQSLADEDADEEAPFFLDTIAKLESFFQQFTQSSQQPLRSDERTSADSIDTPHPDIYEEQVRLCQASISAGDAYELCLTAETTIDVSLPPWDLYKALRSCQPSPFASYIRLAGLSFISCSPERFMNVTASGICRLRPMKGTVKKSAEVSTIEQARAKLDVPKERAENLMIVDLVRHDLAAVCGNNVEVKELMAVEGYETVWQMSSVVEGQLPRDDHDNQESIHPYSGLDVLAASLPPGSMTGAPKKRSCEILQSIEKRERGLYSGVVGYMDVGGRGDWSVNIRCMFRWDDEAGVAAEEGIVSQVNRLWHVGAGGAVTTLSTPVGEREEMMTKLNSVLSIFRP